MEKAGEKGRVLGGNATKRYKKRRVKNQSGSMREKEKWQNKRKSFQDRTTWKKEECWAEWGMSLGRSGLLHMRRTPGTGRAAGERQCQSPGPGRGRSKTREKATEVIFFQGCGKAVINCSQSHGCWQVGPANPRGHGRSRSNHRRRPEVVAPQ